MGNTGLRPDEAKHLQHRDVTITALLRDVGWLVNKKRVERIWRQEGLKVPQRQPKRGRLWLNDGFCIRLRPERPNHVWSYDFVEDRRRLCPDRWGVAAQRPVDGDAAGLGLAGLT
jgi:hypothetical protein